jgi:hypothetical protein
MTGFIGVEKQNAILFDAEPGGVFFFFFFGDAQG